MCYKPTASIILSRQNPQVFPLDQIEALDVHFHLLFCVVVEFLAIAIRQEEIKGIQIRNEAAKLSLFADDIILYIEDPTDSIKKLLNLISAFGK